MLRAQLERMNAVFAVLLPRSRTASRPRSRRSSTGARTRARRATSRAPTRLRQRAGGHGRRDRGHAEGRAVAPEGLTGARGGPGRRGEDLACRFLDGARLPRPAPATSAAASGEIDVVARRGRRHRVRRGEGAARRRPRPRASRPSPRQAAARDPAARLYASARAHEARLRFDVVSIDWRDGNARRFATTRARSTGRRLTVVRKGLERETGFEPATSTLARSHSTTELFPRRSRLPTTIDISAAAARASTCDARTPA